MALERGLRTVPVRLYQVDDRTMLAAPMPGLEPENIHVKISGARVAITGQQRGPRQHERDLIAAEWTVGPYEREVLLPQPVDGTLANATYDNGVLVLVMPKVDRAREELDAEFRLERVHAAPKGERIGHSGSAIQPTTTEEHRRTHGLGAKRR